LKPNNTIISSNLKPDNSTPKSKMTTSSLTKRLLLLLFVVTMVGFCVGLPTNDGEVASQNDPLAIRDLAQGGDDNVTDVARKGGSGCEGASCSGARIVETGTWWIAALLVGAGFSIGMA
jgi:hypothetical protein